MKMTYWCKILIFSFLMFSVLACKQGKVKEEQLIFTNESADYTSEENVGRIDHIHFTDITEESGINFKHITGAFGEKWMPETLGSGGGFLDYNNDGHIDILLVNSCEWPGHSTRERDVAPKLFKNLGNNHFEDVTMSTELDKIATYGMGASFADFDADGDQDIYLTAVGNNMLLRNDGGKFIEITETMKVSGNDPSMPGQTNWSTGSAWVDVDRDGWLDLFVNNYVNWSPEKDIYTTIDGKSKSYATPDVYEGQSCRLYKNIKGRYFEDVTETAGILNYSGKSLGIAIEDFNNDMWPDVVISNDTQPNFLYINNGNGTFSNQAMIAGIAYDENGRARAGMGIDVADIRNDKKLAIVIGNFAQEPLSLYTQTGLGELFQDRAGAARITRPTLLKLTFGVIYADFDMDGYQDLITVNGHIEPEINAVQKDITFEQNAQLFYNNGSRFFEITEHAGESFSDKIVGRGIASADIDNDGDLDVLITVNGGTPKLLRNDSKTSGHFLKVTMKGKYPNLQAIGAKVEVWTSGLRQRKMLRTGSSYLTQSDIGSLLFGLGEYEVVDSLFVYWPTSGKKMSFNKLETRDIHLTEE